LSDPLVHVRAIHFAATVLVAGVAFFLVFVAEPAFQHTNEGTRVPALVRHRLTWLMWIGLLLAVVSGAGWLVLTAQEMSGEPFPEVVADGTLWTVLLQTDFGRDWLLRAVLACLLAGVFARLRSASPIGSRWIKSALVILSAALVGTLAWAGHAAGGVGLEAIVHPAADVLHLVAAAAWVGTLVPLALLLGAAGSDAASLAIARTATVRFSTLGIISVATLLATGTINGWYLSGSVPALFGTYYGRLLLTKIALFFGMVAIAAVNRLRFTPRLVQDARIAITQDALRQLRRNTAIEILAGAIVIAIVAVLGTNPPGLHQQPTWPFSNGAQGHMHDH
jgi:putative copper resistance protein D